MATYDNWKLAYPPEWDKDEPEDDDETDVALDDAYDAYTARKEEQQENQ